MADHSQFFAQLAISGALIGATTFVHALFVASSAIVLRAAARRVWGRGSLRFMRDAVVLVLLMLWLMAAHAIEMAMWAFAFIRLDIFASLESALYFSAISYTTLGFGDVLLPEEWGLLSGAAAANGLLLFGLSAAFLLEAVMRLRLSSER